MKGFGEAGLGKRSQEYEWQHLAEAVGVDVPLRPRPPEFRVSGLPYCPVVQLKDHLDHPIEKYGYSFKFYTTTGTAIHEVLQNSMSNSPQHGHRAFGNWECSYCGKRKEVCFRPKKCKCHKIYGMWLYKELDFKYKGLSGHLDKLTQAPDGAWVAWEFKTTGAWKLANRDEALPYRRHILQINVYCYLLKKLYDIDVSRYVIVYLDRANPKTQPKIFRYDWTDERHERVSNLIRRSIKSNQLVESFMQRVQKKKASREALGKLIESRPCHSMKDYKRHMESRFLYEPCPFMKDGLCAKPNIEKLEKKLWRLIQEA